MLNNLADAVRQGLSGIEHSAPALAARAAAYVVDGQDQPVLPDLRASAHDLGTLLGQPGRLASGLYTGSQPKVRAAARASLAARDTLYATIENDAASIALLMRLGQVLEAADNGQRLDRTGAALPGWLQYLLNDALWASSENNGSGGMGATQPESDAALVAARPAWDVALVAALLAHGGLADTLILPLVFERRDIADHATRWVYRRLLVPGALDDYMLTHPGDVAAAAGVLSVPGRIALVERIGASPPLLAAFSALLLKEATSASSAVRAAAAIHTAALDPAVCVRLLGGLLQAGASAERTHAAHLLARLPGEETVALLDAALAREKSKAVQAAIDAALVQLRTTGATGMPAPLPLPPAPGGVLGADAIDVVRANHAALLDWLRDLAAEEVVDNRTMQYQSAWRQERYAQCLALDEGQLRRGLAVLDGTDDDPGLLRNTALMLTLLFDGRLEARADFDLLHVLRLVMATRRDDRDTWNHPRFQAWLDRQDLDQVDLRQVAALAEACGDDVDGIALAGLRARRYAAYPQDVLPDARVWPLYAARPALIDEGLGLVPGTRGEYNALDVDCTLSILATFPAIPERWLPRVLELALGDTRTWRASAQDVLAGLPGIGQRVGAALQSSKQELRIEAARWLARLDARDSIPALHAALAKETRETVSAALLTALEQLGEDLSMHLAPDQLLAQARKGLKGKAPAGMAWLDLATLPACTWDAGGAVDPDVLRWWVVLACKLKEPAGNALLERYVGLLDPASRAALGRWILHQFIGRDTARPSLEEGTAWAQAHAGAVYQDYQRWKHESSWYAQRGKLTPEEVFEQVKRDKMAELNGNALGEKGMLALAWGAPGVELVGAIQAYMRDHYLRRSQVDALIEAASVSNAPVVIQFLLSIARRYRTASVQDKARVLVQRIAGRNGWSADQLADRTVPTCGLDDDGRMVLQYGQRQFTVTLDAAMKPVLRNVDGKLVADLPPARQDDALDAIKEAKQQLAHCKKELKQVIAMQSTRLYEAMCTGRAWPVEEWRDYLQRHPVVGRLAQRLVWLEDSGTAFRPTEDGSLIDAQDDEVTLDADATIRLAHGALLAPEDAAAWIAHVKDYKVAPLFAQMARPRAAVPDAAAGAIADRLGWISDTFTLRRAFAKLGYQRGDGDDGAVFFEYVKPFDSAGLDVVIAFSGSTLPEQDLPAALKTLSFRDDGHDTVALGAVPPVLLAEAWADYHAVAAACTGFDAHWQKKMPW